MKLHSLCISLLVAASTTETAAAATTNSIHEDDNTNDMPRDLWSGSIRAAVASPKQQRRYLQTRIFGNDNNGGGGKGKGSGKGSSGKMGSSGKGGGKGSSGGGEGRTVTRTNAINAPAPSPRVFQNDLQTNMIPISPIVLPVIPMVPPPPPPPAPEPTGSLFGPLPDIVQRVPPALTVPNPSIPMINNPVPNVAPPPPPPPAASCQVSVTINCRLADGVTPCTSIGPRMTDCQVGVFFTVDICNTATSTLTLTGAIFQFDGFDTDAFAIGQVPQDTIAPNACIVLEPNTEVNACETKTTEAGFAVTADSSGAMCQGADMTSFATMFG